MHIDTGNMIINMDGLSKKAEDKKDEDMVPIGKMTDIKEDVIQFFKDNPNPSDEGENGIHKWAEKNGYDKHDVEETIYELMSTFVEFLTNGRANEKSVTKEDVDSEELKMGIEVEYEHTTDKDTAQRIALDHLAEIKDYYTRLKKMEEDAGITG